MSNDEYQTKEFWDKSNELIEWELGLQNFNNWINNIIEKLDNNANKIKEFQRPRN